MNRLETRTENRARWRTLSFLAVVLVFSVSTWFSATAVIPQLRDIWELSPSNAAWLTIAVQVGFVVGAVVSSLFNLPDLLSSRYIIMTGAMGTATANFLLLFAGGPEVGIPLRFATGFFIAGVYPPAFKLISTWFQENRGLALGILAAALVVGNGIPHLINALGGLDWRIVISITSLQSLLGGLIAGFFVREGPFPFPKATADLRQIGLALKNRGVRLATLGYVGHMWELFAMSAWILVFFVDLFALHGTQIRSAAAFATFAVFVFGGIGSWFGGWLADQWGRTNTTILLMAISGSCAILIGLFYQSSLTITLLIGFIWGITIVGDSAQFSTMVTETADQSYVGTALTIQLAAGFAITVITIWLLPFLQEWFSWRWAFTLLAPGPIIGIWSMLRLKASPEAAKIGGGKG
ncbi:MAG: MFS transporter [candidate division Zixibacteria bacterium]|nr:MFS transporter [Gammaproteobacteria bacterium]NIX54348.1 MFS transporter [candidate division Zixibacteria bacterium]